MALVNPEPFDTKDLFIDVKLSAIVGGTPLNYMGTYYTDKEGKGIEVIDIGFYKDSIAFGITNIEITVNTSLQPVIKIDFKDIAGSTSFGGGYNKEGINYNQLFEWPPPKFKFSFKGYLGGQVTWLLNLKQYSIGFEPSDGSTKISAEFVPNQFGFFADIPYLYLRAVKNLRKIQDPDEDSPMGVFDIVEIGDKVSVLIEDIDTKYENQDNTLSLAQTSLSEAILDGGITVGEGYIVKSEAGATTEADAEDKEKVEVEFNTFLVPKKIGGQEVTDEVIRDKISSTTRGNVDNWLTCNVLIDGKLIDPEEELDGKEYSFYANDEIGSFKNSKLISVKKRFEAKVLENIKNLEDLKSSQIYLSSNTQVGELSISNVMEAIARDSAYLMGSILDAGLKGYFDNRTARDTSSVELIGLNYPLFNDTKKENQEVPARGGYGVEANELNFVQNFILAITKDISSDTGTGVGFVNTFGEKYISDPISNFEALADNPYKSDSINIAKNMLLRSGVASFLTGNEVSDPDLPNGEKMKALAEVEFKNIEPLLLDLIKIGKSDELKDFCEFFTKIFNTDDNTFDEFSEEVTGVDRDISVSNPAESKISEYKKAKVTLNDGKEVTLGQIIKKYLGDGDDPKKRYGIDTGLLKSDSKYSFIGGQLFINAAIDSSITRYIVFKGNEAGTVLEKYKALDYNPASNFVPKGAFPIDYYADDPDKLPDSVKSVAGSDNSDSDHLNSAIFKGAAFSWDKIKDLNKQLREGKMTLDEIKDEGVLFRSPFVADGETVEDVFVDDDDDIFGKAITLYSDVAKSVKYAAMPVAYGGLASTRGKTFDLMSGTRVSRTQRKFLTELSVLVFKEITKVTKENQTKQAKLLSKFNNAEDDIYKQFHALYHQWSSMAQGDGDKTQLVNQEGGLRKKFSDDFGNNHFDHNDSDFNVPDFKTKISDESSTAFVYQFPLQSISEEGGKGIKIKDAIINIDPLRESLNNANTTVLNVIQNICTKNNFTFIVVPGNPGYDKTEEIFSPQVTTSGGLFNTFHIMFLPTPESRTNLSNSSTLESNLVQKKENVKTAVEGFVVKFGSPKNQIVKSIDVDTVDNKVTAESIINLQALVQPNTETKKRIRDCSMLTVMSGRSYKAKLNVLGNAKIFPTQFFFLERTPLFGGLYQIMNVSHTITPNNMETSFDGIRMRFADGDYAAVLPITKQYYTDLAERFKIGENSLPVEGNAEQIVAVQGEADYGIEDFSDHDVILPESAEVIENVGGLDIDRTYRLSSDEYHHKEFDKKYIFIHHTAGGPKARYVVDGWNKPAYYKKSGNLVRVATAFIIGRDDVNKVHECFDPKYWAEHIGISEASNYKFQRNSIGIELCAYGGLKKRGGKFYAWPNKFGTGKGKATIIPENEVVTLSKKFRDYKYFQAYSETQIQALEKLLEYTIEKYNVPVQSNFGMDWFSYNSSQVKNPKDGIYSHAAVKMEKSDLYPDPRLIEVFRKIAKKYS